MDSAQISTKSTLTDFSFNGQYNLSTHLWFWRLKIICFCGTLASWSTNLPRKANTWECTIMSDCIPVALSTGLCWCSQVIFSIFSDQHIYQIYCICSLGPFQKWLLSHWDFQHFNIDFYISDIFVYKYKD